MTNKTVIVRDLEFHYAHLIRPHAPFGDNVWDIQVRTHEEAKADELKALGVNMKKHDDGYWHANIKRRTTNRKGEPNKPVQVVDKHKAPWNPEVSIGHGSKGNIKIFCYDYNMAGRSGTGVMLSAVQITDLVEYHGSDSVDFDVIEDSTGEEF